MEEGTALRATLSECDQLTSNPFRRLTHRGLATQVLPRADRFLESDAARTCARASIFGSDFGTEVICAATSNFPRANCDISSLSRGHTIRYYLFKDLFCNFRIPVVSN